MIESLKDDLKKIERYQSYVIYGNGDGNHAHVENIATFEGPFVRHTEVVELLENVSDQIQKALDDNYFLELENARLRGELKEAKSNLSWTNQSNT